MRWTAWLLVLLSLTPLLSGCWNRRELETVGIALVAAFDWDPERERYLVTTQVAKPTAPGGESGGDGADAFHIYRSEGATVFEAVRNATKETSRKIWWGHTLVILIGEEAGRHGIAEVLDFVNRDGETRLIYWTFITRGRAGALLEGSVGAEKLPGLALNGLAKNRNATGAADASRLLDLFRFLQSPSAAMVGLVSLVDGATPNEKEFRLEGSGVFRKDELVGFLDGKESRGSLWIRSRVRSAAIVIPCPGAEERKMTIENIRARTRLQPKLRNGVLEMEVRVVATGNLADQNCLVSMRSQTRIKEVQRLYQEAIASEITAAINRCRELETDCVGFGNKVEQVYPRYMEQAGDRWHQLFTQVPVTIGVKATVRQTGSVSTPLKPR